MINVRLIGGLGNQLFQLAAAVVYSRRFHFPIRLWPGAMGRYATKRELDVHQLINLEEIDTRVVGRASLVQLARAARINPGLFLKQLWITDCNVLEGLKRGRRVTTIELDGYFINSIDQAFIDEAALILRRSIKESGNAVVAPENLCVIHVRGGDFLKLGWASVTGASYYARAIGTMREIAPNVHFVAITDDQAYASSLDWIKNNNVSVLSKGMLSEFQLLRTAPYAIISNSTFAFWARMLRHKFSGVTIGAPYWSPGVPRRIAVPDECGGSVA